MPKEDGRKNNGGHPNSGRKSKAEEQQLVEKLTPFEPEALNKLKDNISKGNRWAIELFFKYMYGMPKQMIDATTNGKDITANPIIVFGGTE